MRSLPLVVVTSVLALLALPSSGSSALSCGLPEAQPIWIDFADGSVSFWRERFARPGVVVATGGSQLAAEVRAAGAATVHWDMYLRKRVGTPSEPADAALMERRADSLFDYAVSVTGCQQPLITLNELWGASLPTPLTPTVERYRANVLRFVSRLAERGGRPALLVSSEPFTGGEAAAWWKAVGQVSDLVLENYANANLIWRDGAVGGSRRLRTDYRRSAAKLLAVGVPSSRMGLMIGFQTGSGAGGREGLRPRSRWFDVAKWQAFAAWWKAVGQVSDLVLENYANANLIWRDGAVGGSRRLRKDYRSSAAKLLAVGVPSSRIGLMIGFQTGSGAGGREGLRPRSRWFDVAKWQAFAAREVVRELRLSHVWSWGWAQRNERSNDPDKTYAACVWLWARDPALCDAPGLLGKELDADRRAGQIDLPAGVRCRYAGTALTASGVAALAKVTGDRELALTALVVRAVERERSAVRTERILAVERRIVASRFGGSRSAYLAAVGEAGASLAVARGILGDELRRFEIVGDLSITRATSADIARFRTTYAAVLARRVSVSPAPSWLPEGTGLALATSAPEAVFRVSTRRMVKLRTAEGLFTVRALEDATALGAVPAAIARSAITRELGSERRADAYAAWTIRQQRAAESRLVCERDRLPELGVVSLTSFMPFLSLHELGARPEIR